MLEEEFEVHAGDAYRDIKCGLSLKIINLDIHLYFIVIKYLWSYALVEYIDNWAWSYSPVIIYQKHQKKKLTGE